MQPVVRHDKFWGLISCCRNGGLQQKINTLCLDGECINFWIENASIHTKDCGAAHNDDLYRYWLFITASVATLDICYRFPCFFSVYYFHKE